MTGTGAKLLAPCGAERPLLGSPDGPVYSRSWVDTCRPEHKSYRQLCFIGRPEAAVPVPANNIDLICRRSHHLPHEQHSAAINQAAKLFVTPRIPAHIRLNGVSQRR